MHVLHLNRSPPRQFVIQMLASSAEGLPCALRFRAQTVTMAPGRAREQLLVKLISIGSDVRQQIRERDIGAVASWPITGRSGRHQDGSRKHGSGFEHELIASR